MLQLLAATVKLHAFIRYQQGGGHQTLDFFLFLVVYQLFHFLCMTLFSQIMYTLMVIIALVAFVQRDNFPRYHITPVVCDAVVEN